MSIMKYIRCESPGQLSMNNSELAPVLSPGNAILKVKRVGICGTDLHAYKGNQAFFSYPRILGHELATQVLEIGTNPQGLTAGDRTVLIPYINCNRCAPCKAGKSNCCQNLQVYGVHTDGGMKEVISYPHRLLMKANDLSFDEIAIAEPLAIGAHALRRANTKEGDTIVVMGCGPIGIGIIQLAKYKGATVIAIDTNDHRLRMAKEQFHADFTIDAHHAPTEFVKDITRGELANCVIDATGSKQAIENGIHYMQHGGTLVLVGLYKHELVFQHPVIHARETSLLCSRNATPEDFQYVMNVLREKKFNTEAYITKRETYEAIVTGFESWADPASREIKVVTTW